MSDLDNRLESLADGPAPALAPAALVRGRGEQRRRRTRLSVAAVSAAVLVTGGFAYESLSGSWNDRAVTRYANSPTPAPTVTSTPSPKPTPTPTVTSTPSPKPTSSQKAEPRETGLTSNQVLRRDGIGGVTVGMTVKEAEAAAGQRFVQEGDVLSNCVYMAPKMDLFGLTPSVDGAARWPAVQFMFIDGVMSRVDVFPGGKVRTREGIGNGSTEQQVKDAYPGIVLMTPDHFDPTSGLYDPPSLGPYSPTSGRILNLRPDDSGRSMIFATDGVKVTMFRGGLASAVVRGEGCA